MPHCLVDHFLIEKVVRNGPPNINIMIRGVGNLPGDGFIILGKETQTQMFFSILNTQGVLPRRG